MASNWNTIIIDILDLSPRDAISRIRNMQTYFADIPELNEIFMQKVDELYNKHIFDEKQYNAKNYSNFAVNFISETKKENIVLELLKEDPLFTMDELTALIPQINRNAFYRVIAGF